MFKFIKSILKFFLKLIFGSENNKIKRILQDFNCNFTLLDIGAAGGIHKRWSLIENNINIFCVEPQPESFAKIKNTNFKKIDKIFDKKDNLNRKLYLTKKKDTSSLLLPNLEHLKKFKNVSRFDLIKTLELNTTTVDSEFKNIELDFIKIDAEGYHLNILEGSKEKFPELLGLEVEVEFQDLRLNQPEFYKVINFLKDYNFELHDILNIIRWERYSYRHTGQPHTCDLLFFKKPELLISQFNKGLINHEKLLRYLLILSIYNRSDIFTLIKENIPKDFKQTSQINILETLIERKVKKINFVRKYSIFLDNFLNNYL